MRKTVCTVCNDNDKPVNETIKIDGSVVCLACFESDYPEGTDFQGKTIVKEFDPTVCSVCQKDFEDMELNTIGIYPHCNECETEVKDKILPNWVKAFFAGILLIVVFSFAWNWKYYTAYKNITKSNELFDNGDISGASNLMQDASAIVPERKDLKIIANYYKGLDYLYQDNCEKALSLFESCSNELPAEYGIDILINQAKTGVTFDKKDYNGYLTAAKALLESNPESANTNSVVASAYACIYASKDDENAKKLAYEYLNKAKAIDNKSEESAFYYNLIEYRLTTKQIITREEFIKKYPNGWTKN